MQRPLIIGSRGSPLALLMAETVKKAIAQKHQIAPEQIIIKPITTTGDRIKNQALLALGGKGLFTREIETALLEGAIDLAVHSTKDMPALLPEGLTLGGYLQREDARDAFISYSGCSFENLPKGAVLGTAAIRRQALAKALRPDLKFVLLRGNVETRLRKVQSGAVDGTFLAVAGMKRLNLQNEITEILDIERFLPSPGQGAIFIEKRAGDTRMQALLEPLKDQETFYSITAERAFLTYLEGSCRVPLAAYATCKEGRLFLRARLLSPEGDQVFSTSLEGPCKDAALIGKEAAIHLRSQAGEKFFEDWVSFA